MQCPDGAALKSQCLVVLDEVGLRPMSRAERWLYVSTKKSRWSAKYRTFSNKNSKNIGAFDFHKLSPLLLRFTDIPHGRSYRQTFAASRLRFVETTFSIPILFSPLTNISTKRVNTAAMLGRTSSIKRIVHYGECSLLRAKAYLHLARRNFHAVPCASPNIVGIGQCVDSPS